MTLWDKIVRFALAGIRMFLCAIGAALACFLGRMPGTFRLAQLAWIGLILLFLWLFYKNFRSVVHCIKSDQIEREKRAARKRARNGGCYPHEGSPCD